MSGFRHEYKYVCSLEKMEYIKSSVSALLEMDLYAKEQSGYVVRSVYFDDYYDTCFKENMYGVDPREKFRIRIYNADSSRINLELKKKQRGKTKKISCTLTKGVCEEILQGGVPDMSAIDSALYRKFCSQMQMKRMVPKIIVEYDRVPYIYKDGNVRITFDKNIRSSIQYSNFFKKDLFFRPVMEINKHLIEIKYDEILPDFIDQMVSHEDLRQNSFSKYFLCRKYSLGGNIG